MHFVVKAFKFYIYNINIINTELLWAGKITKYRLTNDFHKIIVNEEYIWLKL